MAKVLVVGGAGYVGGTTCAWLLDHKHEVWILDDLSTGHLSFVKRLVGLKGFTNARAGDGVSVTQLLERERFDCVMHFAARSVVSESVLKPELYFENNVLQTRALLDSMLAAGVKRFIFSSTCAVFGDPGQSVQRIHESLPQKPINPYGETKLEVEKGLETLAREKGLEAIALRYFNAAGADAAGRVGEWHEPETHLIPRILQAALRDEPMDLYGTDYPTPDGTAVRDYIHVSDLAAAHEAAMNRLLNGEGAREGGRFEAYNLGSEDGYSVREMITACERAIGRKLKVLEKPRRAGDPPRLVGDSSLARKVLGFKVGESSLDRIFASAWKWEQGLEDLKKAGALKMGRKAVFLDRDGTINVDPGYMSDPKQMGLIPGAGEALGLLKKAGFALVVVSNQSGVARGIIAPDALPRIHARLDELLAPFGATIDRYELCIHHPDAGCECRKPKSKLILDGARALSLDVASSYMVGDKHSDVQAGKNAGCKASVLVRTGHGLDTEPKLLAGEADFIGNSLADAAQWILAQESANP
jgi:UDP-glucose-4-epimerase GalE